MAGQNRPVFSPNRCGRNELRPYDEREAPRGGEALVPRGRRPDDGRRTRADTAGEVGKHGAARLVQLYALPFEGGLFEMELPE